MHYMRVLKFSCLLLAGIFFVSLRSYAQDQAKEKEKETAAEYAEALTALKLKEYRVITKTDTIRFLATLPGAKKKTIVFVAGSGPVPLITRVPEGYYPPFPFQLTDSIRDAFNVVVVSKPGLKVFCTPADLSLELLKMGQVMELDDMNRPPQKYTMNNKLTKIGGDYIDVIKYLKGQPWVDKNNIFIYGHSQGADVAAYVAWKDSADIKGLIYSQSNAYGIYAGYLSTILYDKKLSPGEASRRMDSIYAQQASIINGIPNKEMDEMYGWDEKDLFDKKNNDFFDIYTTRWRSFEEPAPIDYLLKITKPVLFVNGMASVGEYDNKNVPLDFIQHHKRNLTVFFYPAYDHNFFKLVKDAQGNPAEPEFHWGDVFNDVKGWMEKQ